MAATDNKVHVEQEKGDLKNPEANPASQQDGFREYERLDSLLSQVPKKAQHGILKTCDLVLTCIDANIKYIALGTNIGVTFLYSRKYKSMQRLKVTNQGAVITSVCLHDGVDDLVAAGTACGDVTIFCVPGLISVQKKQIQKFDVQGVHEHFITCLEWSTNGMKLFSGDKKGQVVVTEIDFYQGMSKSSSLLIEPSTEITQIDYQNRVLLVSTRQRSFLVRLDRHSETVQIGTKERKMQGQFGACFIPELCKPDDLKLYAARPGCRLWLADTQGTVKNTHIFGDPLAPAVPEISLIAAGRLQLQQEGFQFGKMFWLQDNTLVTWSSSALVVLDPINNRCLGRQGKLSGVVDVAVVAETKEIFLLRRHADARVIRISNGPEVIEREEIKQTSLSSTPVSENVPVTSPKTEHKEESSAMSFFKKLGLPLLKHDMQQAPLLENKSQDSETAVNDLPPVKELLPTELEKLSVSKSKDVVNLESKDGPSHAATSSQDSLNPSSKVKAAEPENSDDIVFSHRMKKHKKKKNKPEPFKAKEAESDSVSQQSRESIPSSSVNISFNSDDESTLKTLKEADKMLSIVQNMITKENRTEVKEETLPNITHIASADLELDLYNKKAENHNVFSEQTNAPIIDATSSKHEHSDLSVKELSKCETKIPEGPAFVKASEVAEEIHSKDKVPEVTTENNPEVRMSQGVTEAISESSLNITSSRLTSSSESTGTVPETHGENPANTNTPEKQSKGQPICDTALSEVDQHMEITPALKQILDAEKPSPAINISNISDTVDSALARVTGVKQEDTDHTEEAPPEYPALDLTKVVKKGSDKSVKSKKGHYPLVYQQSFPDIYMDLDTIEDFNFFRHDDLTESTSEDFYSKYQDRSPTSQGMSSSSQKETRAESSSSANFAEDTHNQDIKKTASHVANSWSEFTAPANIYSLAVSDHHVWFTDKSENIYYSSLQGSKGIVWRKAAGCASQISVSPSGSIVWRLHRGVVYAGTRINTRHPEGLKWVEAVREVQYITVSNTSAWFIKRTGELMMQQGLSKERPCFRSRQVDCGPYRLKQVTCGGAGVVWAITESLQLLVRTGVTYNLPAGEAWEVCVRESPPYLFSHVAIDNENIGWAIDVSGHVWFCQGVTLENPRGAGDWYEVPISGYVMQDTSMLDMIRAAAKIFDPSKLSYIMSANRGGLVCAGSQGIWLAMDFRNLLQVCRGTIKGYHWAEAQPARMAASSMWKHVCASMNHLEHGLVWAQHAKQDMFAFKKPHKEAVNIVDCGGLSCITVAPLALWTLSFDGELRVRTGMGPGCPQGTGWASLDLAQLGDAHFVHMSCNASYIWAVEAEGGVYQRIGAGPPSEVNLNPVWLPIETFGDLFFSKIFVGPLDWMVWGIDNRRLCFVRIGITGPMPLGREWMHVPGIQAVDMAITKTGIWALNTQGEVFFRYGIALDNPTGDYWKKIPGTLTKISATEDDELWGINVEGQLICCKFKLLPRRQKSTEAFPVAAISRDMSVNEDWEIV